MLLKRIFPLLALLLFAGQPSLAQSGDTAENDGGAAPEQQRKQYLVELIVFEYPGPDSSAGEDFDTLVVSDYFPPEPFDIERYNRFNELVSYTGLEHLDDALQRLDSDPRYRIMERLAWTQPLLGKQEAIDIEIGPEPAATLGTLEGTTRPIIANSLSGSVRVYGDYLLFVELDIKARLDRRRDADGTDQPQAESSDNGFTSILGSGSMPGLQAEARFDTYHLRERRRVKLEEYHYFDHPYLGAIVTVWRHQDDSASH